MSFCELAQLSKKLVFFLRSCDPTANWQKLKDTYVDNLKFSYTKEHSFDLAQSKEIVVNKGDGNNNGSIKSFILGFVTYVFCKNHPSFIGIVKT